LARHYPDLTFVTRSGDMAAQGGLVSGGSGEQAGSGLIHKKREIRELELLVASLEEQTTALGSQRDDLRRQSQEVAEGLKVSAARLHQEELRLTVLRKDRQQTGDEITRITERLDIQEEEKDTLQEEKSALEAELKLCRDQVSLAGSASKGLEEETARLKVELDAHRVQLSATREQVTAIRVRIATIKEQHDSGLRALADLEQQLQDISERLGADRQELESGSANRVKLQAEVAAATEHLELLVHKQVQVERQLASIRSAFEEAGSALNAIETQLKESRDQGDTVRQTQADLQLRLSTLTMQAEHLEQNLLERSRIEMTEAVERLNATDFDEVSRRVRQADLQRLLDEMGEVNLMAIEECAGMEERFNFLTGQKDDLEESLRTLQQAIQRINRTTRQRFLETYNLINAKFQEVFPRLFCGGRAELHLTDEEDLLETGIDIIVQPPGKKLQNVTLLSGGEKALTAVALIFSIFLIKPTPFCLLDEVDAPLDDANIGRFNEMVREMSAISQFIIITHNKATMQVADTLYGITMEEPGASRMVSVRLH
jgi:chromosome segregation protein